MSDTAVLLNVIAAGVMLGLVPAVIARRKGHGFVSWWLAGTLIFVVALPLALIIKPNEDTRRQCPMCRTWIDTQARVCPQCGRDVYAALAASPPRNAKSAPTDRL